MSRKNGIQTSKQKKTRFKLKVNTDRFFCCKIKFVFKEPPFSLTMNQEINEKEIISKKNANFKTHDDDDLLYA